MGQGTLTIFSASAGSGKTYKLTERFLTTLFRSKYSYRRILAVTFTHKATAEMKSRILDNLSRLARGEDSEYLPVLMSSTAHGEDRIRADAKEILSSILHDYSRFSVSTIDSFFQKILRAFTREAGLHSGFSIELEHDLILAEAVDEMIASAPADRLLKEWLKTYALSNIGEEKSWNLKNEIISLSQELFREKFKILSADQQANLADKEHLLRYIDQLKKVKESFESGLKEFCSGALSLLAEYGVTDDMFYYGSRGVPGFVNLIAGGNFRAPNSYVREALNDPPKWSSKSISPQLQTALDKGFGKILSDLVTFYDNGILHYNTASVILSNIYALGILSDILGHVHRITTSENTFLLSDAGELLRLITGGGQSEFIYEKTGNRFDTFMIDEFQDTSTIQWQNFSPLIENSMAEGFDNLVVGDVKQSIYRWRNSDWTILGKELPGQVDGKRVILNQLTTNYRSRSNIISFNNSLFSVIPEIMDLRFGSAPGPGGFKELYSGAVQTDPGINKQGYVRIEFVDANEDQNWKEVVLSKLPEIISSVFENGYGPSDIGIIVRDSKDGAMVLKTLLDDKNSREKSDDKAGSYNVVSDDSLLLSSSPAINFIISVLSVVNDPDDMINRALMLRTYLMATGSGNVETAPLIANSLDEITKSLLPVGYEMLIGHLNELPLFEATERIIKFFGLGKNQSNVAYLNSFQDHLLGFAGNKHAGLGSFLDWWESTGRNKSVMVPGGQEAIRILTIHKSKGLEFKVVILPFISWNLDHKPFWQPYLWVRPDIEPFNSLGIVPVRYGKNLETTIFRSEYEDEKYSVNLDNLNLLYVALTRARDVIYGFSVNPKETDNNIPGILKEAFKFQSTSGGEKANLLKEYFNSEENIFEYGGLPEKSRSETKGKFIYSSSYPVNDLPSSLKLKLHGENYFSTESAEVRKKINYGKIMHEIFEGIKTAADVPGAILRLVLEGKLTEDESVAVESRIMACLSDPRVTGWFSDANDVLTETGIILPDAGTRRPDRVILRDGKAVIIDFKFGNENPDYVLQVGEYRNLLLSMGYKDVEAHLWYVDKNKIVTL